MPQTQEQTKAVAISFAFTVSEETLASALTSVMIGGPHGYAYWFSGVRRKRIAAGAKFSEYDAENIALNVLAGGSACVTEYDESTGDRTPHTLTRKKLLAGFAQWVVEWGVRGERASKDAPYEFDIDAPASDAILQFAIFGEEKYG